MGKWTKLHDAAYVGDVAAINKLLQKRGLFGGAAYDVNCRDEVDSTPLHKAASWGRAEAVQALLAAGADVGARDKGGNTPLHYAAGNGHVEAVRVLIAGGADAGVKDPAPPATDIAAEVPSPALPPAPAATHPALHMGSTVLLPSPIAAGQGQEGELHEAAKEGHVAAISRPSRINPQWLRWKVDDDVHYVRRELGSMPLHWAASYGQVEAVLALVAAGADVGVKTKGGDTPLHFAARMGKLDAVQALAAAGADVGAKNQRGRTPLDEAKTDEVRKALAALPPQPPPPVPSPALPPAPAAAHPALHTGGIVMLPSPVAADQGPGKEEELHEAARMGNVAAINRLLRKDDGGETGVAVDVNCVRGPDGDTPLHWAVWNDHVEAVQALVAAGADVGAKNKSDSTPLHYAAMWGCEEALRALVAAGADVGVKDKDGKTPLDRAKTDEVRKALSAPPPQQHPPGQGKEEELHEAARTGDVAAINRLLCKDDVGETGQAVDVDCVRGPDGWTPLHYAAKHGQVEAVWALVAEGADVGAKDQDGKTPLDWASTNEVRKALAAPPPQQPLLVPSPLPPAPPPSILAMYTGGPVTLPSPLAAGQVKGVLAALAAVGLQPAVELVGAAATCNPAALVKACVQLFQAVQVLVQKGQLCHERLQRAVARIAAIEPALRHMGQELHSLARHPSTPLGVVESLCGTLLLLLHVMAQLQEVHRRLQLLQGAGPLRRKLELIKAGGCEPELAALHAELRDCVTQLSAVLGIAHFAQMAQLMRSREELRVAEWQQQNDADRAHDLQNLEELVVEAVGGVQALQQQLAEQRVVLDGQVVGLQNVAEWLQRMQAGSVLIVGHLEQLSSKVDHISEQLEQLMLEARKSKSQWSATDRLPQLAIAASRFDSAAISRAMEDAASGNFGDVVPAMMDSVSCVALKVFNFKKQGVKDCKEAVREAVLLSMASGPHVVQCYGLVYDPETGKRNSIHGSLVMEWLGGGTLYEWVQERDEELGLWERVTLALQVAAGMQHLHSRKLVHGDLKPENVLLAERTASQRVPTAKICDFGLAKYTSPSMRPTYTPKQDYTLAYTSPERIRDYTRTPRDDVYAFGMLLYYVAATRSPLDRIPESQRKDAILSGVRPDIDAWASQVQGTAAFPSEAVQQYCQLAKACWSADPAARPEFGEVHRSLASLERALQQAAAVT